MLFSLNTYADKLRNTICVGRTYYFKFEPPIKWMSPLNRIIDFGNAGRKSSLSNYWISYELSVTLYK